MDILLIITILALVIFFSLTPKLNIPLDGGKDKFGHFISYLVISLIPCIVFVSRKKIYVTSILICLMGIAIEVIQEKFIGRNGSVYDAMANSAGIIVGLIVGLYCKKIYNSRTKDNQ